MRLSAFALAIIVWTFWAPAQAAPPASAVAEINYLLEFIDRSGCRFYRNGSWYDSHRAQSHLRDKYDFLAARGRIKSADDFIEQAATRSSMSGEEYQIQCEAGPQCRAVSGCIRPCSATVHRPAGTPPSIRRSLHRRLPIRLGRQAGHWRMLYIERRCRQFRGL
jgi:hypothetical protein